jgi:hypothetical protein
MTEVWPQKKSVGLRDTEISHHILMTSESKTQ